MAEFAAPYASEGSGSESDGDARDPGLGVAPIERLERDVLPVFYFNAMLVDTVNDRLDLNLFEPRYREMCRRMGYYGGGDPRFLFLPNFRSYRANVGDVGYVISVDRMINVGTFLISGRCTEAVTVVMTWVEPGTGGLSFAKVVPFDLNCLHRAEGPTSPSNLLMQRLYNEAQSLRPTWTLARGGAADPAGFIFNGDARRESEVRRRSLLAWVERTPRLVLCCNHPHKQAFHLCGTASEAATMSESLRALYGEDLPGNMLSRVTPDADWEDAVMPLAELYDLLATEVSASSPAVNPAECAELRAEARRRAARTAAASIKVCLQNAGRGGGFSAQDPEEALREAYAALLYDVWLRLLGGANRFNTVFSPVCRLAQAGGMHLPRGLSTCRMTLFARVRSASSRSCAAKAFDSVVAQCVESRVTGEYPNLMTARGVAFISNGDGGNVSFYAPIESVGVRLKDVAEHMFLVTADEAWPRCRLLWVAHLKGEASGAAGPHALAPEVVRRICSFLVSPRGRRRWSAFDRDKNAKGWQQWFCETNAIVAAEDHEGEPGAEDGMIAGAGAAEGGDAQRREWMPER